MISGFDVLIDSVACSIARGDNLPSELDATCTVFSGRIVNGIMSRAVHVTVTSVMVSHGLNFCLAPVGFPVDELVRLFRCSLWRFVKGSSIVVSPVKVRGHSIEFVVDYGGKNG